MSREFHVAAEIVQTTLPAGGRERWRGRSRKISSLVNRRIEPFQAIPRGFRAGRIVGFQQPAKVCVGIRAPLEPAHHDPASAGRYEPL